MQHNHPGPSLICANFDGASVMQGRKNGVVGHILNKIPDVIPIHCIAHKLELAVLDSIKNIPFLKRYEEVMKGIFIMYHASPKKLRDLQQLATALDTDILRFSDLKKTRWVSSKSRAVIALKNNLTVVAAHLEAMAADNIPEAKAYHTTLVSVQFLKIMHLLLDFLPIITRVSKVFQYKDIMIFEVEEQLEGIMLDLLNLSTMPGENMKDFMDLYKPLDKKFADVSLKGPTPVIDWKDDAQLKHLVQDTISYLDKRFACFKEEPLKYFRVFDYSRWPRDRIALAQFGTQDLVNLLSTFPVIFSDAEEIEHIKAEFSLLKAYLVNQSPNEMKELYEVLLATRQDRFKNILKVIELMCCISPCTAECERGFSTMKSIKTPARNRLDQETLQFLMKINLSGPSVADYVPDRDVNTWLTSKGTKHVKGHTINPVLSQPRKIRELEPEDK